MTQSQQRVALIGANPLAAAVALRLMEAGCDLTLCNPSGPATAAQGVRVAASVAEAAAEADVVLTLLELPEDVEELYLARGGLVEAAHAGSYLIDLSTSSPALARDIAEVAEVSNLHAFDAPLAGGVDGVRAGTALALCGASEKDVAPVRAVLEAVAPQVAYFGGAGKGQLAKLACQTAFAGCMVGLVEALSLAKQGGLELDPMLAALNAAPSASIASRQLGPQILAANYAAGEPVSQMVTALCLALEAAEGSELTLPGVETANQLFGIVNEIGGADKGVQALDLVYADEATCAANGLDWALLDEEHDDEDDFEGADHGDGCECGCGHDHDHDHHHHHHGCDCGCEDDYEQN